MRLAPFALVLLVPLLLAALPIPQTGQGPTGAPRFVQVTDAGYPLTAPAPGPDGYRRTATGVVNMTNLPAAGSTGYKLTATCYECETFDEAINMCTSLTCTDGGGVRMGVGSRRKICMDQTATGGADGGVTTDWSGWSTSATGDWVCTPIN